MRRTLSTAGGLVLMLSLLLAAMATTSGRAEQDKAEDGFVSLFNGKDLTGWTYKGSKESLEGKTETPDGRVAVEGGVIVMREKDKAGKGGIKDLYTVKQFPKAFHLKVDFRAGLKADSGVYVRGPQLQVRDYIRRNEQKHLKQFKNDDWNTLDIVVLNDVVLTTVNGKALTPKDSFTLSFKDGKASASLNGKEVEAKAVQVRKGAVADCKINGEPLEVMANIPNTGAIGLQAETGKFEFRNVRIKELDK